MTDPKPKITVRPELVSIQKVRKEPENSPPFRAYEVIFRIHPYDITIPIYIRKMDIKPENIVPLAESYMATQLAQAAEVTSGLILDEGSLNNLRQPG